MATMMPKKRIALFSLAYAPFESGAEIAARAIANRLPHHFFCFTHRFNRDWPERDTRGNVEILRVSRGFTSANYYGRFWEKTLYVWRALRAAEKLHKKEPFNAIWAIMASYAGIAATLFKLRHPEVKFLLTLQEGDSEEYILRRVGIFYPFWKLIFKKADLIQTISNHLADFAKKHRAMAPIEVVPNGVNLEKTIGKKNGGKTAITTSRLVHKNGIDILIKAITKISEARLLILGSGPEEGILKDLVRNLKTENRIEFLGQIEPDRVVEYLRKADIFVRPSRSEGLGNSFLEAMAAGLPIIGTPVGGIPDFLKDGETGLFCKVENPEDLADKIKIIFSDKNLYEKLSKNGRKLVEEKYSWDLVAEKMGEIFKKL